MIKPIVQIAKEIPGEMTDSVIYVRTSRAFSQIPDDVLTDLDLSDAAVRISPGRRLPFSRKSFLRHTKLSSQNWSSPERENVEMHLLVAFFGFRLKPLNESAGYCLCRMADCRLKATGKIGCTQMTAGSELL